ncbi:MAG: flagellar motor switch protein FliN [Methylococcaceae bacterium]
MEEQDAVEVTADEEPGWDSALDEQQASTEDEQPAAAAAFESFDKNSNAMTTSSAQDDVNLDVILDVPVTISMEIGRSKISIRNLLQLNQGSVVELDRLAGEPMDVLVNGTLIAHGEVVVVNDKFGIRLTDVVSPIERVKKLKE